MQTVKGLENYCFSYAYNMKPTLNPATGFHVVFEDTPHLLSFRQNSKKIQKYFFIACP